jgi:hypothetical protein
MTAPYKRTHPADQTGYSLARIRTLEANRTTLDAEMFTLDQTVSSVGGDDPIYYYFTSACYVTGNLLVTCFFAIGCGVLFNSFDPGTGSQYLITMPAGPAPLSRYYGGWFGYADGEPPLGQVEAYDDSGAVGKTLSLRISAQPSPITGDQALEAWDPVTGNLWGPTYPFTWADDDALLQGVFTYPLDTSLLDATSLT